MSDVAERLRQLGRLIDLKRLELDQASMRLQDEERVHAKAQTQLQRLQAYAEEYQQGTSQPVQPRLMAMRGEFLGQLQESIVQQQRVVASAEQRLESAQTAWFELRKFKEMLEEKVAEIENDRLAKSEKQRDAEMQEFFQYRRSL